jgi:uncharacterized integral membrane protein
MRNLKLTCFIVLAVLALLVILQNTVTVQVRILTLTMSAPLAFLLFMTLLVGMVLGVLVAYLLDRRAKMRHA